MVDPSTLIPWISPIITAVVAFIKTQGAQKAGEKAAEVIGEKATEATLSRGEKALATLRSWFAAKADAKAQQALANVEQDPDDEDYQQKLAKETVRVASADPIFAQDLKVLADNVTLAQAGGVAIDNKASNMGAQGVFNAPVQFDNRQVKEHEPS